MSETRQENTGQDRTTTNPDRQSVLVLPSKIDLVSGRAHDHTREDAGPGGATRALPGL